MFPFVRPALAPAFSLLLALLTVLALGAVNVAHAQTVTLELSSTSITENSGTATVTATVSPASATPFTVEVSAAAMVGIFSSDGRVTVSGTTLSFAADATRSTGTVTITAVDNDGHTDQRDAGVTVRVSGTVSGGTSVTGPDDETLTVNEDDGIGTATDSTRPKWASGTVDGDRAVLVFSETLNPDVTLVGVNFLYTVDGDRLCDRKTLK